MPRERRKNFRVEWTSSATIELPNGRPLRCIVANLSNGGAKIAEVAAADTPDEFGLRLSATSRRIIACQVVWRRERELGVKFVDRPAAEPPPAKIRRERVAPVS